MADHIYPIYDRMLPRDAKESLLQQKGRVYWLTGLSGAGKSTLAIQVERRLHDQGHLVKLLDGDNIRSGINADLGFTLEARRENIRRCLPMAVSTAVGPMATTIFAMKSIGRRWSFS